MNYCQPTEEDKVWLELSEQLTEREFGEYKYVSIDSDSICLDDTFTLEQLERIVAAIKEAQQRLGKL